ncbi:hypothetical protein SCD_n01789 [Sulfuricella denitrificans skB26]|uniref:Large ribosomal subunit protein bL9 n=1 Tax=Sulfuricella denitrificans (strain DSM 22764 / NBRC 105220 / skB26) TaxID=1163617 RepID=S6AHH7_SULDS|nr:hypothetical protein SCD_n01789 [Sulfuricella denitrificans skB26]
MQLILLEKVVNLGQLGDIVKVKDGYGRNFLIPQGKAKRATEKTRPSLKSVAPNWKSSKLRFWPMQRPVPRNWKVSWSNFPRKRVWMVGCSVPLPTPTLLTH